MKLFFKLNEDGDITAQIQDGTSIQPFNYVVMLKQLISNNCIEDPDFDGLDITQQNKIKEILTKIHDTVGEELNKTS